MSHVIVSRKIVLISRFIIKFLSLFCLAQTPENCRAVQGKHFAIYITSWSVSSVQKSLLLVWQFVSCCVVSVQKPLLLLLLLVWHLSVDVFCLCRNHCCWFDICQLMCFVCAKITVVGLTLSWSCQVISLSVQNSLLLVWCVSWLVLSVQKSLLLVLVWHVRRFVLFVQKSLLLVWCVSWCVLSVQKLLLPAVTPMELNDGKHLLRIWYEKRKRTKWKKKKKNEAKVYF